MPLDETRKKVEICIKSSDKPVTKGYIQNQTNVDWNSLNTIINQLIDEKLIITIVTSADTFYEWKK